MSTSTFTERLPHHLSPEEISQKGHALVDCMRYKVQLEAEKAEAAARIKLKIKENDKRAAELAQHYETGIEWRETVCEDVSDFEHACIRTFRRDTNEVLRTRIMKAEERQAALDFNEGDQGEQLEGMRAAPETAGGEGPPDEEDDDDEVADEPFDDGEATGAIAH